MFGYGLRPRYWGEYNRNQFTDVHFEAYRDYGVFTLDFPIHKKVFPDSFLSEVSTQIHDDYRDAMKPQTYPLLADQRIAIDLSQRVPRMTIAGVESVRQWSVVRLPFFDNDLLDFALSIPPGLRIHREVMVQGFIKAYPRLAKVPTTPSGVPLVTCARDIQVRSKQWFHWHVAEIGLGRFLKPLQQPYHNYPDWFRTVLRPWTEGILFHPRAMDRGYYRPQFVRDLWQEHLNGRNHSVCIGAMLSIELWHRAYID
jgi:asparagine synthetase B (glutamine-hydrolysing)